jgi:hypothetical protein
LSELTQNSFQLAANWEGEIKEENGGGKEVNSKLLWKRGSKMKGRRKQNYIQNWPIAFGKLLTKTMPFLWSKLRI